MLVCKCFCISSLVKELKNQYAGVVASMKKTLLCKLLQQPPKMLLYFHVFHLMLYDMIILLYTTMPQGYKIAL